MDRKQESNEQIVRSRVSGARRTVVLDIETVALDPSVEKGALDAMSGRVVCIGMLIDDGQIVTEITLANEDERRLITEFWRIVAPSDVLVGHNVLDFDLRFLRQRSWILGIEPSRKVDIRKYYSRDVIDTLQLWTNWGNKKGVTLDALGLSLSCGGKAGSGANVARWWGERDIESIKSYCQEDVRLAYRVFCRLTYREAKQIPSGIQPVSVAPSAGTIATGVGESHIWGE
jgi:3'-5' exonuclease